MSKLIRIFKWFYNQSLKLYPKDFHKTFDGEMANVFVQAVDANNRKTILVCLKELKDLPGSLILQHWLAFKKEKLPMAEIPENNWRKSSTEDCQPGTLGEAFLAAIPHFLMGLLISLGLFGIFDLYETSEVFPLMIGIALALLVIAMLVFASRRGWPLWSASWYLYGTWVILSIIGLTIENLNLDESWRFTNVMFFGWILVCIIGYFFVLSKSKLHGLLSVAFLFPLLGMMFLEFIPNPIEGWLVLGLGSLAALTVGTIVLIGEFRMGLWLVFGVNVIAGLSIAYVGEYQIKILPPGAPAHVPKFSDFLELLVLYSIFALGIISLPFILRSLLNFGRNKLSR